MDHQKDFMEFHKKRQNKFKKLVYLTKTHLEQRERKEQNARDKEEKKRIELLMVNDFDAYINLINTEKNSRLMDILNKTHKFLEQLGSKVLLQKNESKKKGIKQPNQGGDGEGNEDEPNEEDCEEFQHGEIDAYGNKREEKDLESEDEEMNDQKKVKENLRNSSKIYYKLTHSI